MSLAVQPEEALQPWGSLTSTVEKNFRSSLREAVSKFIDEEEHSRIALSKRGALEASPFNTSGSAAPLRATRVWEFRCQGSYEQVQSCSLSTEVLSLKTSL